MFTITKDFAFSSSHVVEGLRPGHQCGRLHGHNYVVRVEINAPELDQVGFVVDFGELKPVQQWLDAKFDHHHLNDQLVFNPTAENMARYIADTVWSLLNLPDTVTVAVGVSETPKTWSWWRP